MRRQPIPFEASTIRFLFDLLSSSKQLLQFGRTMFIVIFTTSLLTFIVLVISSASYLISLICNESDDGGSTGSLPIDAHDFSTTPTVSPIENFTNVNHCCHEKGHHHSNSEAQSINIYQDATIPEIGPDQTTPLSDHNYHVEPPTSQKQTIESSHQQIVNKLPSSLNSQSSTQTLNNLSWNATPSAQKNVITSLLGVSVSKQLFDDFDQKEMQLGGTGLHWCKTRKSLDKLIQIGVPLNVHNNRQETALHVAIRKRKLQVLIGLLCNDAKLECLNEQGDTPFLLACKMSDIFACQLLIVFDADYNVTDHHGYSARHYVASICERHKGKQPQPQLPSASHLILAMLHEIGAERCSPSTNSHTLLHESEMQPSKQVAHCTDGCAAGGSYNGNSYNRWPNFRRESLHKRHMFADIIEARKNSFQLEDRGNQNKAINDNSPRRSRMLCIDGGGMRGVITCQILIEIQKYLKKPILSYFDWIGGTSVGAYLCCALSIGTSLTALRRNCFDVKDEVFCGNKPYNSKFLERVLKRTFGASTRMSDSKVRRLAVTTVLADRDPCQLRFFRNYKSPADLLEMHGYSAEWFNTLSHHSNPLRSQLSSLSKTASAKSMLSRSSASSVQTNSTSKSSSKRSTSKSATQPSVNKAATDDLADDESGRSVSKENKNDISSIDYVIDEDEQDPLMWQAVRASGAAPFFFKPYGPYLDGGIISNNPTMDILTEFYSDQRVNSFLRARMAENKADKLDHIQPPLPIDQPSQLDIVVSLGTGRGRVIGRQAMIDFGNVASGFATVFSPVELLRSLRAARDLFKKLMQQSCQTEDHILDRAQAWCSSLSIPYFRVNPPLASIFSIDDKRDEQLINALWQTKLYMSAMRVQLEQLGTLLDGSSHDGQDEIKT